MRKLPTHRDTVRFVEFRLDAPVSVEGMRRVNFINEIHGFPIFFGNAFGLVVETGSGYAEERALFLDGDLFVFLFNEISSLIPSEEETPFF